MRPTAPTAPRKAGSDHLARAYFHTYGLPVVTTNCSNNYGPYQFPEKLLPLMIRKTLRGRAAAGLRRRIERPRLALRATITAAALAMALDPGRARRDLRDRRQVRD